MVTVIRYIKTFLTAVLSPVSYLSIIFTVKKDIVKVTIRLKSKNTINAFIKTLREV